MPDAAAESFRGKATVDALVVALLPAIFVTAFLLAEHGRRSFAVDFEHAFYPAARDVLHGRNPFPPLGAPSVREGIAFAYPPLAAYAVAPFALLPVGVAAVAFTALSVVAFLGALRLAGVRDGRVYGVALLWGPVGYALQTGNLSLFLALGVALLWRWRDRPLAAAALAGPLVVAKLFLWPLLVWLLLTRRVAAFAGGVLAAAVALVVPWAALGFAGVHEYRPLLRSLTRIEEGHTYTVYALAHWAGVGGGASRLLADATGLAVLGAAAVAGRRGRDADALTACVAAALLLSPIVWLHYFVLLAVPLVLLRPRLGLVWLLPVALWWCPVAPARPGWAIPFALVLIAATLALATVRRARCSS